ncbi:MAG: hypothetical protein IKD28_00180 [Clostridia bacterium]|nr:hypothetical protein [Clostridia bacterium]
MSDKKPFVLDEKEFARLVEATELALDGEEHALIFEEVRNLIAVTAELGEVEDILPQPQGALTLEDLREDKPQSGLPRATLLENVPSDREPYISVPRVVE